MAVLPSVSPKSIFMKSINLGFAVFLFLFFIACKKDEVTPKGAQNPNPIRFDNPAIGQASRYVRFSDSNANDDDNNFNFIKDTLVLEIVASDSNGFKVKETLTPGSDCLSQTGNPCSPDAIFYYFKIENDSVTLYDPR
jgi:hypothetical protein